MDDRYEISYIDDIAVMRLKRTLPLDEVLAVLAEISAQVTTYKRMFIAEDHFIFNDNEIRAIADQGKALWDKEALVAYVAYDDLSFNLLRMLEIWRETDSYQIRVFADMDAALEWLQGHENPTGSA